MSQVKANYQANNVEIAVKNGQARTPAMIFQAQVGTDSQTNVVALCPLQAQLPTLNAHELLECAVIHFHQPSALSHELTLGFVHLHATGRPVVRVAVWVNGPKYFDEPIAAQVNGQARWRDVQFMDRLLFTGTNTHLSVAFQACPPIPSEVTHQLE